MQRGEEAKYRTYFRTGKPRKEVAIAPKRTPARVNPISVHASERRLSLSGSWQFRLDPHDQGVSENWAAGPNAFTGRVTVPGTWQGQGHGTSDLEYDWGCVGPGIPARILAATYAGTGWYAREFTVPPAWKGLRIWLNFGGVHPSADVWLNGEKIGEHIDAPFVPFAFEVTTALRYDRENFLAVRVHEYSRDMGMAFNWQGTWSGLYRDVELTAAGDCNIESLWLRPSVADSAIGIRAQVGGSARDRNDARLAISVSRVGTPAIVASGEAAVVDGLVTFSLSVPSPELWSPDSPNLYRVDAVLSAGGKVADALSERTGFVTLGTKGKQFLINGDPYYMRGTGDFGAPPQTSSPTTDRTLLRRNLTVLREYGYNYVRAQSFAHVPEYYDIADEIGLLVQGEMGILSPWAGYAAGVYAMFGDNWPFPTPDYRDRLKFQWDSIVERDVHHPSANLYSMSSELILGTDYPRLAWQTFHDTKRIKPTAMVTWTSGYRVSEDLPGDFIEGHALDKLHWIGEEARTPRPVIQHEFQWWTSYPDVRIHQKYEGCAVRPFMIDLVVEAATRRGISHLLPEAATNSQRLQYLEAKGRFEMLRRDAPRLAGVNHFMAMDIVGSPQGVVDEFYDKKYADPEQWRQFFDDTVIVTSLGFHDRVLEGGQTKQVTFYVSDFAHPAFSQPELEWSFWVEGREVDSGREKPKARPYQTSEAGAIEFIAPSVERPSIASLTATLRDRTGRHVSNQWEFWVFPASGGLHETAAVYGEPEYTWLRSLVDREYISADRLESLEHRRPIFAERLDGPLLDHIRAGGRVVLAASEGLVRPFYIKRIQPNEKYFFAFTAIDPPMTNGHLGTIIRDHPMLGELPHEGYADLQFIRVMGGSPPLDMEGLGLSHFEPVVRTMHTPYIPYPLAYLIEGRIGKGALILSAFDFDQSLPEARYMVASIYDYASGDPIGGTQEMDEESIEQLVNGTAIP